MERNLQDEVNSLRKQLENSVSIEDVLAAKVHEKALSLFKLWLGGWLIFATILLGIFGYTSYQNVNDAIAEFQKEKIQQDLQKELDSLKSKIVKSLQDNSIQYTNNLDRDLAKIIEESKARIDDRMKSFAAQVDQEIGKTNLSKQIASEINLDNGNQPPAFAYYGVYSDNEWNQRNFSNLQKEDKYPSVGDFVKADLPVNARKGVIQYIEGIGWQNKPLTGTIGKNDKVKILEVITVAEEEYIWIKFEKF